MSAQTATKPATLVLSGAAVELDFAQARVPYADSQKKKSASGVAWLDLVADEAVIDGDLIVLSEYNHATIHDINSAPCTGRNIGARVFDVWQQHPELFPREWEGALLVATGDLFTSPSGFVKIYRTLTYLGDGEFQPNWKPAKDLIEGRFGMLTY